MTMATLSTRNGTARWMSFTAEYIKTNPHGKPIVVSMTAMGSNAAAAAYRARLWTNCTLQVSLPILQPLLRHGL